MHAFLLGAGFDDNVDALLVGLGYNVDVGGGGAVHALSVGTDIISSGGHLMESRHLLQQVFLYLIHHIDLDS